MDAVVGAAGRPPERGGEDVVVTGTGGRKLVSKVDMFVEKTDMPPRMSYRQAARKAVAACVSDFAAKGVKPEWFLTSLGVKRGTSQREAMELGKGFRDAEREWNVKFAGGDTNETDQLVIDCAMFGFGEGIVERSGAKEGEVLVVTGGFGLPPAGLLILGGRAKAGGSFRRRALDSALNPSPNLRLGQALSKFLTSSMDSSDGLARSLHTLAESSGVGFEVTQLPLSDGVEEFARKNGVDHLTLVLEGGEEYSIVGTVRRRDLQRAARAARRAGGELKAIGKVTGKATEVTLSLGGRKRRIEDRGWTHLGGRRLHGA